MYPVKLGFDAAIKRIEKLSKNEHHAESLITSVFTTEKTLRRTLRFLIVSCGFKSLIAEKIINNIRGLDAIKNAWEFYDPEHKKLVDILGKDWQVVINCANMRNNLVHGIKVYKLDLCKEETKNVLASLKNIKKTFEDNYGYSGWTPMTIRKKSRLHIDSRIKKIKTVI
jgi:hypothetical protein